MIYHLFLLELSVANRKKYYSLPDYKTVTDDIDVYIKAWRDLAEPIERELNLKMTGFDPVFTFADGNQQMPMTKSIELPVWFVRDLSQRLGAQKAA